MLKVTLELMRALERGEAAALATVTRVAGSTPQVPGARLLLTTQGLTGTVGGGRIEHVTIDALRQTLDDGQPRTVSHHLARDLGMCCGGEMEIFVERAEAEPTLVLFGAGHVSLPTAKIARQVGFDVVVVDPRDEFNTDERFPECTRVQMTPSEAYRASAIRLDPNTYVVICTHDHAIDEEALRCCIAEPTAYLGMIGSKRKVIRVFQRIQAREPNADVRRVRAPIGLDIGALTPDEIAVSIVAELVSARRGGSGGSMTLDTNQIPDAASDS